MGETGNLALDGAMDHLGPFGDVMGKLETLAMGKLGAPDDLMGKLGALDHELFSNGLIRLHCTVSNLWAPNFKWKFLDDMQAEKKYMRPQFFIFRLIFQRSCDDYQCLIFGIFCHVLRLMGIYRVGALFGYLKSFVPSFLFFLFFPPFFLRFFFFCLFLGAPLAPGPLDIVHPCHPVATPLDFNPAKAGVLTRFCNNLDNQNRHLMCSLGYVKMF